MHDSTFPESEETPEARSARAVAALEYEQRAGLGFRRRDRGQYHGDPWAEPERAQIDANESKLQLAGAYVASLSVVFGLFTFVMRPLLFAPLAVACGLFGLIPSERSARIARAGLILAGVGFVVGMVIAITFNNAIFKGLGA